MRLFSYRLFQYSPQVILNSYGTMLFLGVAHAAFTLYLAVSAVAIGRGLAGAALAYSAGQRFALLTLSRERGYAVVFDSTTGAVGLRALPEQLREP